MDDLKQPGFVGASSVWDDAPAQSAAPESVKPPSFVGATSVWDDAPIPPAPTPAPSTGAVAEQEQEQGPTNTAGGSWGLRKARTLGAGLANWAANVSGSTLDAVPMAPEQAERERLRYEGMTPIEKAKAKILENTRYKTYQDQIDLNRPQTPQEAMDRRQEVRGIVPEVWQKTLEEESARKFPEVPSPFKDPGGAVVGGLKWLDVAGSQTAANAGNIVAGRLTKIPGSQYTSFMAMADQEAGSFADGWAKKLPIDFVNQYAKTYGLLSAPVEYAQSAALAGVGGAGKVVDKLPGVGRIKRYAATAAGKALLKALDIAGEGVEELTQGYLEYKIANQMVTDWNKANPANQVQLPAWTSDDAWQNFKAGAGMGVIMEGARGLSTAGRAVVGKASPATGGLQAQQPAPVQPPTLQEQVNAVQRGEPEATMADIEAGAREADPIVALRTRIRDARAAYESGNVVVDPEIEAAARETGADPVDLQKDAGYASIQSMENRLAGEIKKRNLRVQAREGDVEARGGLMRMASLEGQQPVIPQQETAQEAAEQGEGIASIPTAPERAVGPVESQEQETRGPTPKATGETPASTVAPATISQTTPQSEQDPRLITTLNDAPVVELPVAGLKLSKDVPNFKEDADPATGEVRGQVLKGKAYSRLPVNPVTVWERANGDREIITGRHRFGLAKRLGEKTIPAQVVREADGFTKEMAITFDAEANIRDNQGRTSDYANYFRNSDISEEEASSRSLLNTDKGRKGWNIGKNASDDLYALYRSGGISEAKADAIARAAPGHADLQGVAILYAKNHDADTISAYIHAVSASKPKSSQLDLFGRDDAWQQEADAIAKAVVAMQGEIRAEYSALRAAKTAGKEKYASVLKQYGFKAGDAKKVEARIELLARELDSWERWATDPQKVAQAKERAGIEPQPEPAPSEPVQEDTTAAPVAPQGQPPSKPLPGEQGGPGAAGPVVGQTVKMAHSPKTDTIAAVVPFDSNTDEPGQVFVQLKGRGDSVFEYGKDVVPVKSLKERALKKLDDVEREARDEINRLKKGGTLGANAPAGILANYVAIGAVKIAKGAITFTAWMEQMVAEFGNDIRPRLADIWARSRKTAGYLYKTNPAFQAQTADEAKKFLDIIGKRNLSLVSTDQTVRDMFTDLDAEMEAQGMPKRETVAQWDSTAKREYAANKEGTYLDVVANKLDYTRPEDVRKAMMAIGEQGAQDLRSGDITRVERAVAAGMSYRNNRTEHARILRAGVDPLQTPAQRIQSALMTMLTFPSEAEANAMRGVLTDPQKQKIIRRQAERLNATLTMLRKLGIDPTALTEQQLNNRRFMQRIVREIQAAKSGIKDKVMEYWKAAILSGFGTHAVNTIGNAAEMAYEYWIIKPLQATLNSAWTKATGKPMDAVMLGDLHAIYGGLLKSSNWKAAFQNFLEAFDTEVPISSGSRLDTRGVAIGGTKGRIIRLPFRFLLAADEFSKTMIMNMEVAAQAAQLGRAQGVDGAELDAFVAEQVNDTTSEAWGAALDEAKRITHQQRADWTSGLLKARRVQGPIGWMAEFIFPFVTTPSNIVAKGLRRTPLGLPNAIIDMTKAIRGTGSQTVALREMAEQLVGFATLAVLVGMVGDDDDDGMPKWITGSSEVTKQGRDFQWRTIPPQHVKLPGTDTWVSYSKIEPLATSLSVMVDVLRDNGKSYPEKTQQAAMGIIRDKSFMQGLSKLVEFFDSGTRGMKRMDKWSSDFAASYMPNLIRSGIRAWDDTVRDYMIEDKDGWWSKDWLKRVRNSALPLPQFMPPAKVDIFGRDVKKDSVSDTLVGDFAYRLLVPVNVRKKPSITLVDQWLFNYNNAHPDKPYFPSLPRSKFTIGGKEVQMTEEEYHDFLRERGNFVVEHLGNISIDAENPSELDRMKLDKLFDLGSQWAKGQMLKRKRANGKEQGR